MSNYILKLRLFGNLGFQIFLGRRIKSTDFTFQIDSHLNQNKLFGFLMNSKHEIITNLVNFYKTFKLQNIVNIQIVR